MLFLREMLTIIDSKRYPTNLSQCFSFRLIKIFERAASISCCESHYNITQLLRSDKNSFNFTF